MTTGRNVTLSPHRRLSHDDYWFLRLGFQDRRSLRVALVGLFYLLLCLLLNTSGQLLNILGEILESNYDYREIVKGLFYHAGADHPFSTVPADLVHSTLAGDAQRTLT